MCEYEKSLVACIDGELETDTALELERHLQTCDSCSAKASQYRELSRAFAAYCAAAPVRKSSFRWRWTAVAAGFAAAVQPGVYLK
jgi:anti-sigma factor RsiW